MRSSHLGFYLVDKSGLRTNVGTGFSGLGLPETGLMPGDRTAEILQRVDAANGQQMTSGLGKTVVTASLIAAALWFFMLRK